MSTSPTFSWRPRLTGDTHGTGSGDLSLGGAGHEQSGGEDVGDHIWFVTSWVVSGTAPCSETDRYRAVNTRAGDGPARTTAERRSQCAVVGDGKAASRSTKGGLG